MTAEQTPVTVLALPARTTNALLRAGITTIGQLATARINGLMEIHGLGRKSVEDICAALDVYLVAFSDIPDDEREPFLSLNKRLPVNLIEIIVFDNLKWELVFENGFLPINRLTRWSAGVSVQHQLVLAGAGVVNQAVPAVTVAARLELDVNTAPQINLALAPEFQQRIYEKLILEAREIVEKGDIP